MKNEKVELNDNQLENAVGGTSSVIYRDSVLIVSDYRKKEPENSLGTLFRNQ